MCLYRPTRAVPWAGLFQAVGLMIEGGSVWDFMRKHGRQGACSPSRTPSCSMSSTRIPKLRLARKAEMPHDERFRNRNQTSPKLDLVVSVTPFSLAIPLINFGIRVQRTSLCPSAELRASRSQAAEHPPHWRRRLHPALHVPRARQTQSQCATLCVITLSNSRADGVQMFAGMENDNFCIFGIPLKVEAKAVAGITSVAEQDVLVQHVGLVVVGALVAGEPPGG